MSTLNIVMVEPEIPQNTGNVARTCAVTGARLHLVEPLGFTIDDKKLKRAGLDYWRFVNIAYYDNIEEVIEKFYNGENFYFLSTKGKRVYSDVGFKDGDFLVFGKETRGLNELLLEKYYDKTLRIPMIGETRSLNLSNSVALCLYEALRQGGFAGFNTEGQLTGRGY